jgi:hypothetical protein
MRKPLCVVLALSLALAAAGSPGRAETASAPSSAPPRASAATQPIFCFRGTSPDRQERNLYAVRARRDASRASKTRAGDRDDTAFIIILVLAGAALIGGEIYLASHGL